VDTTAPSAHLPQSHQTKILSIDKKPP
jgi:hypothetical protein